MKTEMIADAGIPFSLPQLEEGKSRSGDKNSQRHLTRARQPGVERDRWSFWWTHARPGPSPAPAQDVLLSSASSGAEGLPIFTQRMPRKTSSSPRLAQSRSRERQRSSRRPTSGLARAVPAGPVRVARRPGRESGPKRVEGTRAGDAAHQRRAPRPGVALLSGRASSSSSELPRTEARRLNGAGRAG